MGSIQWPIQVRGILCLISFDHPLPIKRQPLKETDYSETSSNDLLKNHNEPRNGFAAGREKPFFSMKGISEIPPCSLQGQ